MWLRVFSAWQKYCLHKSSTEMVNMKRNDFGSIRQLPSGRFQVRYRDTHGIQRTAKTNTGKPLTFAIITAARKYLVNLESAMDQGKTTGDTSQGLELLQDRVEKYISGARLTKGQLKKARQLSGLQIWLKKLS